MWRTTTRNAHARAPECTVLLWRGIVLIRRRRRCRHSSLDLKRGLSVRMWCVYRVSCVWRLVDHAVPDDCNVKQVGALVPRARFVRPSSTSPSSHIVHRYDPRARSSCHHQPRNSYTRSPNSNNHYSETHTLLKTTYTHTTNAGI